MVRKWTGTKSKATDAQVRYERKNFIFFMRRPVEHACQHPHDRVLEDRLRAQP
jgi:hypothetical protein